MTSNDSGVVSRMSGGEATILALRAALISPCHGATLRPGDVRNNSNAAQGY